MAYKIYFAGELNEIGSSDEHRFFQSLTERYWLHMVTRDHHAELRSELHEQITDVYIIAQGEADLYLGGIIINPWVTKAGQRRGTGLQGAKRYRIHGGDVIIIPEGVPHMFDTRDSAMTYTVLKVDMTTDFRLYPPELLQRTPSATPPG